MAGSPVYKSDFDFKISQTIIAIREAFEDVDIIAAWLANHPSNAPGGDLLTKPEEEGGFGYTDDEAYLVRIVFEGLSAVNLDSLLEQGRKLTGLH